MGPVGHSLSGISFYLAWKLARKAAPSPFGLAMSAFLANLPDFDLLPVFWVGLPEANAFHHSLTHTPAFALACALIGALAIRKLRGKWSAQSALLILGCVAIHIAGDYLTRDTGYPYGEMIFWPCSSRYYLGSFLFLDIYKGSWNQLFSMQNLKSCVHEIFIFIPMIAWLSALSGQCGKFPQPERYDA
jgi:hypothetical protein